MITETEIENQAVHVKYLKSEMQAGYADLAPERWAEQRGYIPTCEYYNRTGPGTWTEGVAFVVLDDEHIAWREDGDFRDNGDWVITDIDNFVNAVIADAEEFLARWQEENDEA
jgi:hypothetical protein